MSNFFLWVIKGRSITIYDKNGDEVKIVFCRKNIFTSIRFNELLLLLSILIIVLYLVNSIVFMHNSLIISINTISAIGALLIINGCTLFQQKLLLQQRLAFNIALASIVCYGKNSIDTIGLLDCIIEQYNEDDLYFLFEESIHIYREARAKICENI